MWEIVVWVGLVLNLPGAVEEQLEPRVEVPVEVDALSKVVSEY